MRKFLTFTLVIIMLLSTLLFTGCDAVSGILLDYFGSQNGTGSQEPTVSSDDEKANISAALQKARNAYVEYLVENGSSDSYKKDGYIRVEQNGKTYYFAVVDTALSPTPYEGIPDNADIINQ